MSELASNIGVIEFTITNNTSSIIPRGTRVTRQSNGNFQPTADQTTRGDAVTLVDIPASGAGTATFSNVGKVAAVFDTTVAVGAAVYAGASSGQFSGTSTNAVVMGRCVQAATSAIIGEVQLMTVL